MIKEDSKTLREFSLNVVNSRGTKIRINYGYDMSSKHSGYYLAASINGGKLSSSKEAIRKVRALKIDALNDLIDSIGTDVTGKPYEYDKKGIDIFLRYINNPTDKNYSTLVDFYRVKDHEETELMNYIAKCTESRFEKGCIPIIKRYNKSRRVEFLNRTKRLVSALRVLYYKGVEIGGKRYLPKLEGKLKKTHYPTWYKRDVDYIRKSRVNVYTKILKRKYIPFNG